MTGVVRDQKTGRPLANVGVTGHEVGGWWENSAFAKTDAEGRYRLVGLPKAPECRLTFYHDAPETAYLGLVKTVKETEGLAPLRADMEMVRGVVVTGQLTDKATASAVLGHVRYFPLLGNKELENLPGAEVHTRGAMTYSPDANGRFRFITPPGLGVLFASVDPDGVGARRYIQARTRPEDRKQPYFADHGGLGEVFYTADRHLEAVSFVNAYQVINPLAQHRPGSHGTGLSPGGGDGGDGVRVV